MNEELKKMLALIQGGLDVVAMRPGLQFPLQMDADEGEGHQAWMYKYEPFGTRSHVTVPVEGTFLWRPDADYYSAPVVDTDSLTSVINALAADDNVESVTFMIDSPGGDARGIRALHNAVKNLAEFKQTTAVNRGLMCSAAYYGFAGATTIESEFEDAMTGSIGCYSMLFSIDKMLKDFGVDVQLVSSGGVKGQGSFMLPIDADYKAETQARVDEFANEFRGDVLAARPGINVETAFNGFHWRHEKAMSLGLVDGLTGRAEVNNMNEEQLKALLETLTQTVQGLAAKMETVEANKAETPVEPKEETPAATPTVSESDEFGKGLLIRTARSEGKITPENEASVLAAIANLDVKSASKVVAGLEVAIKTETKSDPNSGEPKNTESDKIAKAFRGKLTSADIDKYRGANSYSIVQRDVRAVATPGITPHESGELIVEAPSLSEQRKVSGANSLDKFLNFQEAN